MVLGQRTSLELQAGADAAATTSHAASRDKFKRDDALARVLILTNLEPAEQDLVLSFKHAREMWDKLVLLHEQRTATNKSGLQQQFFKYEMGESDTAMQHVAKIVNLASRLKDVGVELPEETVIAKMLSSLIPKYETSQIAWDSVAPACQTLDRGTKKPANKELKKRHRMLQVSREGTFCKRMQKCAKKEKQ